MAFTDQLKKQGVTKNVSTSNKSMSFTDRLKELSQPKESPEYTPNPYASMIGDIKMSEQEREYEQQKWQEGVDDFSKQDAEWRRINTERLQKRMQAEQDRKPTALKFVENLGSQMKKTIFGDDAQTEVQRKLGTNMSTGSNLLDTTANIGGTIAGYAMPIPGAQGGSLIGATNTLGKAVTSKLPRLFEQSAAGRIGTAAIEGVATGAPIGLYEGVTQGLSPKETAKSIAANAALGAAGGAVIQGFGEGFFILRNALKKPVQELAKSDAVISLESIVKPKTLTGNYKAKNVELNKAYNEYDSAIKKIQDYFGTDQLRESEMPLIKSELGIDLDKIVERLSKYEKYTLPTSESLKLKRVAGAASDKSYSTIEKVIKTPKNATNAVGDAAKKVPTTQETMLKTANKANKIDTVKLQSDLEAYTKQKIDIETRISNLSKSKNNIYATEKIKDLQKRLTSVNEKIEGINLQLFALKPQPKTTPFNQVNQAIGDIESARTKINYEPPKENKFKDLWTRVRTQLVDKYAPLEKLEKNISGKVSSAESSLYKQARLFEGVPERANKIISNELEPIIKDIEKKGYTYKDLGLYSEMVHARDVNNAGLNSGFTKAEIDDVIKKLGAPEMEAARKKLVDYSDKRLQSLVKSGVISRKDYSNIASKWKNYMPLNRSFNDEKVEFGQALRQSFANVGQPIKKLEGSSRNVIDPIESIIKNTYQIENASGRNKVGLQLSDLAKQDAQSQFVRKLNPGEEVGRKNVVNIFEKGEKVKYEVEPEVYKAMLDMNNESANILTKILSKPVGLLRAGATLTPDFALRNPIRDVFNAFITSKSGFNPITDFAAGLGSYMRNGKLYNEFILNNGGYGNIISMSRQQHREALEKIIKQPVTKKFVNVVNPKSWLKLLQTISDATESATKVGEYRAALRKGVTPEEAAYRARDLMDFARGGSATKNINKVIAFLNANVQGKSKFIRAIKEDPGKVIPKLFVTMAAPSLGTYAMYNSIANDEQKATIDDAPNWLRDTFWLVPVPGTDKIARIPKPFDAAAVSNVLERFLDYTQKNDKEAFDGFMKEFVKEQSIPVMLTGLGPIIEGMTNYSFFREAPIIPKREENLLPQDQYDIYTSEISKGLASVIQNTPGLKDTNFASPRVMDNTIKGLTAGLGTYVMEGADKVIGKNTPAKNATQLPVAKAFTVNENSTGKSMEFLYNEKDNLTKERTSFKQKNPGKSYPKEKQYDYINKQSERVSKISSQIRSMQNDAKLTPTEKRDKINSLSKERNNLTREIEKEYKSKWLL